MNINQKTIKGKFALYSILMISLLLSSIGIILLQSVTPMKFTWLLISDQLLAIGLTLFFIFLIFKIIIKPLKAIHEIVHAFSQGNIPQKMEPSKDEFGEIFIASNILSDHMENVRNFATEVGKGNFETTINVFNNEGDLGEKLAGMRDSLIKVAEEDKRRNWGTNGLAQIGEILRSNTENAEVLYYNIISFLVKYLKANQGGMFIINDENKEHIYLDLVSCYAYERKKSMNKIVEIGEGLVGQAVLEKEIIYLTDVPDNYVSITSGIGEATPRSILIVPLKVNDEIHGVIELASFKKFEDHEIEFMKKLGESIASTISGVKVTARTKILLFNSQEMTEELRAQEEEMRQNVEELQTTQEEISRKQAEMHGQMAAINSTSAFIEFDLSGNIIHANDLFLKTMKYSLNEITGKHHRIFVDTKYAASIEYEHFWSSLNSGLAQSGEFKRIAKDRSEVWIVANYTPVLDNNGNVIKVIKLASDITDQKLKAINFQGQLEAINKSTAVIEFDLEGTILSANSLFCNVMGYNEKEIIGKHHAIFVKPDYKNSFEYKDFWEDLKTGNFKSGEFKRINKSGAEIWIQGSYNPIYNLNGSPYKVVKFANEITEQKNLQLKSQNDAEEIRKLVDSYETRIKELEAKLK